jgi:hypothetical protein
MVNPANHTRNRMNCGDRLRIAVLTPTYWNIALGRMGGSARKGPTQAGLSGTPLRGGLTAHACDMLWFRLHDGLAAVVCSRWIAIF